MSSDRPQQHRRPTISHPLTRQRSHGLPTPDAAHLRTSPPRPTSPPPRGYRSKPSIFALIRRSGGTLDSVHSASYEEEPSLEVGKAKGKARDRWSKRASRKAPPPPPRERGESEELDWERIRTLPRVRLVPPEDEGDPVMLYPIPHPSSLMPLRTRPQSPPSLLTATVAATLIDTDPNAPATSPPSPTRRASASPPNGVVLNSLAHATFVSQQHGHWIGMSDKFILPPPVFSRGPAASGRAAATRGIIMPKTRRQLEADIGKRMSMVEQRKRDSLELERFTLLPPLEEAAQSPPNVMMPPVSEREEGYPFSEDEDLPLAIVRSRSRPSSPPNARDRSRPSSPPNGRMFDAITTIHSVAPFDMELPQPSPPAEKPILGPAIELKPIPARKASYAPPEQISSPPLVVHIQPPRAKPTLPAPQPVVDEPPAPVTRQKRSKSLTAVLSRSSSDDGPSTRPAPPPVPLLKRQKSLKALFFPSSEAPPPVPQVPPPSPRNARRASRDLPEGSTSKKGKLSRAKSKPSLRIEVKSHTHPDGESLTPALATASSSGYSDAYPLTPGTAKTVPVRDEDSAPAKGSQTPSGIRSLSKRFSLSNMSGAFRKKSSISGMIPVPSEAEVPMVPQLPAVYRKTPAAAKSKGKSKAREEAPPAEPEVSYRRRSHDSARGSVRFQEDRDERPQPADDEDTEEESYGEPIAGPSRASSVIVESGSPINRIGLSSLGTEPFDILDADFEFPPTSASPVPSSEGGVHGAYYTESAGPTPTHEDPQPMAPFEHFPDPETSSMSSCGSLDDDEQPSIVHAQLMQVSPTTRRNPGVSMQEFLGTVPLPQTGVLVASPTERRRSVEGVITGPLLGLESPLQVLMKEVKEAKIVREVEEAKEVTEVNAVREAKPEEVAQAEKKEKKRRSRAERPPSGSPLVIDLRGQYLKGIGPSGSRGAQHLLGKGSGPSSPTSPGSVATILAPPAVIASPPSSQTALAAVPDDREDSRSETSASEEDKEGVPETPLYEHPPQSSLGEPASEEPAVHDPEQHSQSSSIDSLVIVEVPPPPSPPLHPVDTSARNPSRSSTPRSRYTTPEALLRLLTSPLGSSRLSRSHHTPGSNSSGKTKKGATPSTMPIPPDLEGLPIPRQEDGEVNWSALLMGTQLGSLHFDDLGLDMSFVDERPAVEV